MENSQIIKIKNHLKSSFLIFSFILNSKDFYIKQNEIKVGP